MNLIDIFDYAIGLEVADDIAKNNGIEYVEWRENVLMEVLYELGVSNDEFNRVLKG